MKNQDNVTPEVILGMFDTVITADITSSERLTLIDSLSGLYKFYKEQSVINAPITKAKSTVKVALKPVATKKKNVYSRWKDEDRKQMFIMIKKKFGSYSAWEGKVTPIPYNGGFNVEATRIGERFGRSMYAIKSQVRDVVQPLDLNNTNRGAILKAKKLAYEVGLIDQAVLNA
jgi:hypothetical protein